MKKSIAAIPKNVFYLGFVGFFMQFGASLVYATGNVFVEDKLLSDYQLILVRGFSESIPHIIKVFSGYLSDKIRNRKLFLLLGYGSMIFFKICFFICSLTWIFPILFLSTLYVITQVCDRIMNCLRDGPRDALVVDSTPKELLSLSFAIRKSIASFGSIFSGLFSFTLIYYNKTTMSWMYFISIFPVITATLILYYMIKDVPWKEEPKKNVDTINITLKDILMHLSFNLFMGFVCWNNGLFSLDFLFLYINSLVVYQNFNKLGARNFEPLIAFIFIIIGASTPMPYVIKLLFTFLSLTNLRRLKLIIPCSIISFLYSFLITLKPLQPVILCILSGLLVQIIPYVKKTPSYQELCQNKENLYDFIHILVVCILLVMGRINDTVYFNQLIQAGCGKIYTILLFVLMYICISISSMVFGYLLQWKKQYLAGFLVFFSLIASNILLGTGGIKYIIISSVCAAIYSGGMETVFTTMVSYTIPSQALTATLFGLFYTFVGIFNFVGVTFFDYVTKNSYLFEKLFQNLNLSCGTKIQTSSKIIVIWPIIGMLIFLLKRKKSH